MNTHSFFYLILAFAVACLTYLIIDLARSTLAWLNVQGISTSMVIFGVIVCALSVTLLAWAQSVKHD